MLHFIGDENRGFWNSLSHKEPFGIQNMFTDGQTVYCLGVEFNVKTDCVVSLLESSEAASLTHSSWYIQCILIV